MGTTTTTTTTIGPVLGAREARAHRAAQRWVDDGGELRGVPLVVVQRAVARAAEQLARDLDPEAVARVCLAAVDAEEQRLAEEAIASAREEERLAYVRRRAADYRLAHSPLGSRRSTPDYALPAFDSGIEDVVSGSRGRR